jgi:DNA-binding NtrC family response regulator
MGNTIFLMRYEPSKPADAKISSLVGTSLAMRSLRARIEKVASEDRVYVLLLGETGVGKELVARALHELSPRHKGPFVAVNCGAITESLAESELFGHAAKAFTDAEPRDGCFRSAHRGTLFLDEIGDMPTFLQPKLFRVLQQRAVTPVGSDREEPCDVRVVSATNQDLQREIQEGTFRAELHSRLAQFYIEIPPLRERREDILLLLHFFFPEVGAKLTPDLTHELILYHWPQNIRQLSNVAVQLRIDGVSNALRTMLRSPATSPAELLKLLPPPPPPPSLRTSASHLRVPRTPLTVPTREAMIELLQAYRGTVVHIAERCGCSRRQIQRWLEMYGLDVNDYRQ